MEKEKNIYLYLHDNHFDVITSMPAFFARKRYCHACKKPYDKSVDHMFPNACQCCHFPDCPIVSWVSCIDCNRMFKSRECFDRHKQNIGHEGSVCASLVKCLHCNSVVKRGRAGPDLHHCGQSKCKVCKEYVDPKHHQCYMQTVTERSVPENGELPEDGVHDETPESGYNKNSSFLTLSVDRKVALTNQICVWFKMKAVMNGYSKGIIREMISVSGCLQKGTRDV